MTTKKGKKKQKTCSPCFYRVIETLVEVWKNSKELWKHSPAARVRTAFSLSQTSTHSILLENNAKQLWL